MTNTRHDIKGILNADVNDLPLVINLQILLAVIAMLLQSY